jgi:hypothetical protein
MQSNRVASFAVLFLLASLIGIFAYWFYLNFEPVEKEVRSGLSVQARRNPWLAAERLLGRLGIQVESRSGRRYLTSPPEEIGVLFVKDLGAPLPRARQDALLAWVDAGGHLVLSPGLLHDSETDHSLLARFGVELVNDITLVSETGEGAEPEPGADSATDTQLVALPESEEDLHIGFDPERWFYVDSENEYWETPVDTGPNMLIFPWGAGRVTFLSDNRFWDNERIGDGDHALLLARLVDGYDRAWLLYSSQMPSLPRLLWHQAPYLLTSLGVLAVLLLWWMTRRTGPRLYRAWSQRRDLLEHLQAAAEFAWRTDSSSGLLENARRQVERRWLASHPRLQRLEQTERCRWLAERTGLTSQTIEQALYGSHAEGGQLIKNTTILQRLLSALHPQTRKR